MLRRHVGDGMTTWSGNARLERMTIGEIEMAHVWPWGRDPTHWRGWQWDQRVDDDEAREAWMVVGEVRMARGKQEWHSQVDNSEVGRRKTASKVQGSQKWQATMRWGRRQRDRGWRWWWWSWKGAMCEQQPAKCRHDKNDDVAGEDKVGLATMRPEDGEVGKAQTRLKDGVTRRTNRVWVMFSPNMNAQTLRNLFKWCLNI
jgi:hypothetical protein